ncbi:mucin-19-like [Stegodyphus dumicola]|uniref:mucin-19-like n=1 Tax=Stegodyphus dumicola TaxID=202533 RepID=UPI0015AE49AB|nr:mucin-19-like [Stegodyphus dumicola]
MFAKEASEDTGDNEIEVEVYEPDRTMGGVSSLTQQYPTGISDTITGVSQGISGTTQISSGIPQDTALSGIGYGTPSAAVTPSGIISEVTNNLASALLRSNLFQRSFNNRVPSSISTRIASELAQSIISKLQLDYTTATKCRNSIIQAVSGIRSGSDTRVYAQAIASVLISELATTGRLNASNASAFGSSLLSGALQGAYSAARQAGLDLSGIDVTSDISSSLSAYASSSAAPQTASDTQQLTEGISDVSKDFAGGYEAISKTAPDYGVPSAVTVPSGVISNVANNLASALLRSSVFQRAFNSRVSSSVANRIVAPLSGVRSGSDTRAYALAIASAIAAQLAAAGRMNASNATGIGSSLLSGVLQGTYAGARQAGIDVSGVDLTSDISSSNSAYGAGPAVALDTAVTPQFPESISDISQGISAVSEGMAGPSYQMSQNNLASALLRSTIFQRAFNARISASVANRIAAGLAQSIASSFQLDYGTTSKCREAIIQALSSVRGGSDTQVYATAIATTLASQLVSAGRLNASNASGIGTTLLSGVLQGTYSGARQAGVDVSGVDVSSDISSSISAYGAGPAAGQVKPVTAQYSEGISDISQAISGVPEGITGPGTDYGAPSSFAASSSLISNVANNLGSALLRSNTFQRAFNARVSTSVASRIAAALAQSIASTLQLDYGTASKCRNAVTQAVSGIRSGSDTRVYALAIASALATQLAAAGRLNSSNAPGIGSSLLSGVVQGAYSGAREAGVDMSGVDVSSDISSSVSAYGAGETTSQGISLTPQYAEGISDISQGISAMTEGITGPGAEYGAPATGVVPSGVISDVANNLASALLRSNIFERVFNARSSSSVANRIAAALAQTIASSLQLDYTSAAKCKNAIMQALSGVRSGSDTRVYALAIASALAAQLAAAGRLNSSNASSIGSSLVSGVVQGAYSGARQAGVDVSGVDVSSDISSSISAYAAGFTAGQDTVVTSQFPEGITGISQGISAVSEGVVSPGADYGAPSGGAVPSALISNVANNLASALLRSNIFKRAFNARVSSSVVNRIAVTLAQSIASSLQLDYGTASKCRNAIVQALSGVRRGSNTNVYALAIASAIAAQLATAGRLNTSNASSIGSSLLSGAVQGAYSGARQAGVDVSGVDVSSDISSSISAYGASSTAGQDISAASQFTEGISDISQGVSGVSEGISGPGADYGAPSVGSVPSGVISDVASNLATALLRSNIFQRSFNGRVSSSVANRIAAALVQSIASSLQLDYGTAAKCRNAIMQALSGVKSGSDTRAYALAIASALIAQLADAGRLNASNASSIGSSLLSTIVQGAYSGARQAGIDVSGVDVSSDISSSISAYTAGPITGADTAATKQFPGGASDISQAISGTEGMTAPGPDYGVPSVPAVPSGILSDVANNLASALLRSNVFQRAFNARVSSSVANRIAAALAQTIPSSLQLDYATAAKCRSAILQALSEVRSGSDTRVYALAIASSLATQLAAAGRLNASNASRIGSSLISGVVQGAYSGARQAGIDVSGVDVSSDISSSISAFGAGTTASQDVAAAQQFTESLSDISQGVSGVSTGIAAFGADYGAPSGGAVTSGKFSDVENNLASALMRSNVFQRAFNARVSSSIAKRIATALAQSIASSLQLDYGTASKCRNAIMQALSGVRTGSDTRVYAIAIASALTAQLAAAGRLNASNASGIGTSLLSGVVQGAYSGASQAGVDVSGVDVSSDISSSISAYRGGPTGAQVTDASSLLPEGVSDISQRLSGTTEGVSGPALDYGAPSAAALPSGILSDVANNLASALLSSNLFQRAFNARVSSSVANRIAAVLAQSISSSLQLDYATASKSRNAIMQALSGVRSGSDTRAYALAIASALVAQLAAAGRLNASNASGIGSSLLSGVVQGAYSGARQVGVDVTGVDVSSDISSSISAFGAGSTAGQSITAAQQFTEGITDVSQGVSGVSEGFAGPGADYGAPSVGELPSGIISDVANNVASALLRSNVFQHAFNARISSSVTNRIGSVLAQSIASTLQLDYATATKCRNAIMQALSGLRGGSNTRVYAQAIASALVTQLAAAGRLNASNASGIGSSLLSGVVQGAYSGARQAGVDVSGVDVSADISSSISAYGAGSTPGQDLAAGSQFTADISDVSQGVSGVTDVIAGTGADYGVPSGGSLASDVISDVSNNLASALLRSNVFQRAFSARVSSSVANRIAAALAQSICTNLQLDYRTASKCRSAIMQALSSVRSGSDTRVYAMAIASALVAELSAAGRLNASNASGISSSLLSSAVQGAYSGARQAGIDVSGVDLTSDISSSISAYGARSAAGLDITGPQQFTGRISDISQTVSGVSESFTSPAADYGAPSSGAEPSGVISEFSNNLASALLKSKVFQRAFNSRVSSSVANRISAALGQSIASSLQLDYATASQCKNAIMQAISGVRSGSETRTYALAIASALAGQLAAVGRINTSNSASIGSSLVSGIVQGAYSAASQAGVDVSGIDVSSDISSSLSAYGTSRTTSQALDVTSLLTESSSGISQSTSGLSDGMSGLGADYGAPSGSAVPSSIVSNVANKLASALLRSNVFQLAFNARVTSSIANKIAAVLAQSIASSLQLDYGTASKCRNAIMQALSGVRTGSETRVYALAIATAVAAQLAAAGRLNASNASGIGSSLLSGVVQGAYSGARQAGVDVSGVDVSSDISSSISAYGAGPTGVSETPITSLLAEGISDISQGISSTSEGVIGPGAGYPASSSVAVPSRVISNVANNLVSALLRSTIFQRAFNARVSSSIANRIASTLAQSIASGLQLDYATASKCRNAILQAISGVKTGSDTRVYAVAVASALAGQLAATGRLNASNASGIGSSLLSGVVQGTYSGARQAGVDVSGVDVSSDISSSISAYGASSTAGQDISAASQFTEGISDISRGVSGVSEGISGPGADYGAPSVGSVPSGVISDVASNLATALLRSNIFQRAFNGRVSSSVANRIAAALVQSIASSLQLDYGTAAKCRNAIMQALSGVRSGSDTRVYALAIASALVAQLAAAGRLNASNASGIGTSLLSGVVQGTYSGARQAGVDVSGVDVSSDISSSISAYGAGPTGSQERELSSLLAEGISDISQGVSGMSEGISGLGPDYGAPSAASVPLGVISDVANNLATALLRSNIFQRAFNGRVSSSVANRIASALVQSIASSLQLDYGTAAKCRNAIMQGLSGVRSGSDTRVYALAIASALVAQLAAAGRLNASNASGIGTSLLSGVVQGTYSGARQAGVDVSGLDVSSDISSSISAYGAGPTGSQEREISSLLAEDISDISQAGSGVSEGISGPGADYGAPSAASVPSGVISDVANNLATALLRSNIFQRAFNGRVSSSVANRIASALVQSIASSLQLDYGTAAKCRNAIMQALSGVRSGSDTRVYALAIASALVAQLAAAGRLNASNASGIGTSLLSGVVQGTYSGARQAGVDVSGVDVSSDISSSISAYGVGPTGSQEREISSLLAEGISDISQGVSGVSEGISGPGADYGAPSVGSVSSGVISDVANNLATALLRSNIFQRAFNGRVSSSVANRIAAALMQSIASSLQLDYGTAAKCRNAIMQALSGVRSGSDTRVYALAIASALVAQLAAAGRLTSSNASDIGSSLLSSVVQGAYSGARQAGVDVSGVDVRSDISTSISAFSSGTSSSQTPSVSLPLRDGVSQGLSEISRGISGVSERISESGLDFGGLSAASPDSSAPFTLPAALRSPDVTSRVNSLTSAIVSSIGPKGVDMNAFGSRLVANISNMLNSGASSSEAVVETLIETIAALLQVASSAQIRSVNTSSTSFVVGNLARALSSVSG